MANGSSMSRRNDWVLKVIYRTSSAAYDIAGLQPIGLQHERMINVDVSDSISGCSLGRSHESETLSFIRLLGHGDYRSKAIDCVKATGLLRVEPTRASADESAGSAAHAVIVPRGDLAPSRLIQCTLYTCRGARKGTCGAQTKTPGCSTVTQRRERRARRSRSSNPWHTSFSGRCGGTKWRAGCSNSFPARENFTRFLNICSVA